MQLFLMGYLSLCFIMCAPLYHLKYVKYIFVTIISSITFASDTLINYFLLDIYFAKSIILFYIYIYIFFFFRFQNLKIIQNK